MTLIVCAPDSFKESISATAVAAAMASGIRRVKPDCVVDRCPIGDGGEGTLDALLTATGGVRFRCRVTGPLGGPIEADLGLVDDGATAIVELASASGLALVPPGRRDPLATTTYGTGELIAAARDAGAARVLVCIGGSATVDGGAGIAQALGARFLDRRGATIATPMTGGMLGAVSRIEPPPDLPPIEVACDVENTLCGPDGAARVYGPQKGATPADVRTLDAGLGHLAELCGGDPDQPGSGAAGGAAFGLASLCGARLRRGIDLVLELVAFDRRCTGAALVLTGEGCLDGQSRWGKATVGVAEAAARHDVPVVAIVGSTGPGVERCGLRHVSLTERFGGERALAEPATLIERVAGELATS